MDSHDFLHRVFWLGTYERYHTHTIPWLFEKDYGRDFVVLLEKFGFSVPTYTTDERRITEARKSRPPITGFHLLVSFSVISFGLSRATLEYRGFTTAPDVLDWVFVVVASIGCVCTYRAAGTVADAGNATACIAWGCSNKAPLRCGQRCSSVTTDASPSKLFSKVWCSS